jgi:serine/threonine-protein kinase
MECQEADTLKGTSVSHYTIGGLIGSGGMGKVYFARDERLCRDVAVKVINGGARRPAESSGALIAEARMLSRLNHPNVAGVYEVISEGNTEFLVMEFVPGPTVRQLLSDGPLPLPEVLRLGAQLARGLGAIHAARIAHRDIKPENLKVTTSGDLKIIDFGVATPISLNASADGSTKPRAELGVAGTLHYMSPEQLRGGDVDERSDIYSAGAVLYEMAAGRPAFEQRQVACLIDAILHDHPVDLARLNATVPRALADVVMKALNKLPDNRQQTAHELGRALVPTRQSRVPIHAPRVAGWLVSLLG